MCISIEQSSQCWLLDGCSERTRNSHNPRQAHTVLIGTELSVWHESVDGVNWICVGHLSHGSPGFAAPTVDTNAPTWHQ